MQLRENKLLCAFTSDKLEVFSLSPSISLSLSLTHDISRVIKNLQVVYRKSCSLISYASSHLLDM